MIDFRTVFISTLIGCVSVVPVGLSLKSASANETASTEEATTDAESAEGGTVELTEQEARWLPDPANNPLVFISSSCAVCKLDKPMSIGLAADQAGTITILLLTPEGEQTTLLSQEVEANEIKYVTAVATAPVGKHALIALFGEQSDSLAKTVANIIPSVGSNKTAEDEQEKGLQLLPELESLIPHAIREFEIVE